MKRAKYILLFLMLFVIVAIGLKIFIPKGKNKPDQMPQLNKLNQKDSINNTSIIQSGTTYEIKNLKAITSEKYFAAPVWSPDGKMIALTDLNFKGISVENVADGTPKKITDDEGAGFRFSWSPDSKEIVYLSRKVIDGEPANAIKLIEIETGKIIELTACGIGASMPSFSKSSEIIYSYKGTLMRRKGSIDQNTNKKSYEPEEVVAENVPANIIVQSPGGDKLIIEDDEGIKIMDSSGENRKTVVKNGENDFARDAKISLEGDKVLFSNNSGSTEHLYVYNIGNEKLTDLGEGHFGQWLPDAQIIYCISADDGFVTTGSDIYLIHANGSGKRKITDTADQIEIQPTVSPDCKSVVYRDGKSGLIYWGELKEKK